jgi:hypothetical protein
MRWHNLGRHAAAWLAVVVLIGICCPRAIGVVGGEPAPANDHRFDAVGLVVTDQPWAACLGWISGTCVLIGTDTVLLARHQVQNAQRQLPAAGARTHKIRFRRAPDGEVNNQVGRGLDIDCAGGFQEIYIDRFIGNPAAGVDMVLGVLERAPAGIRPLPLHVSHVVTAGEPVVLAGWGYDGTCVGQGQAWTLRVKSGVIPPLRYNGQCCFDYNNTTYTAGNCIVIPPNTNWVVGNLHDSGAPLLSPDPANPSRLRVFALVSTVSTAQKLSLWNAGGGLPRLVDTPATAPCMRDFDGDSLITISDLLLFVQAYLLGDPRSDVDGAAGVTLDDLLFYVQGYVRGC